MIFRMFKKENYKAALKLSYGYRNGVLVASICTLFLSMGSAWSYESYNNPVNYNVSREALSIKAFPSTTVSDACKTLLVSGQRVPSGSNTVKNRRTAGKIAALGVILGARFALEPNDNGNTVTRHEKTEKSNNRSAQAVAAFRKCQKEHVLSMATYNR